jgi:hypothetical protein
MLKHTIDNTAYHKLCKGRGSWQTNAWGFIAEYGDVLPQVKAFMVPSCEPHIRPEEPPLDTHPRAVTAGDISIFKTVASRAQPRDDRSGNLVEHMQTDGGLTAALLLMDLKAGAERTIPAGAAHDQDLKVGSSFVDVLNCFCGWEVSVPTALSGFLHFLFISSSGVGCMCSCLHVVAQCLCVDVRLLCFC